MKISKDTHGDISSASEKKIKNLRAYSVLLYVISVMCFLVPLIIMMLGYGKGDKNISIIVWSVMTLSLAIGNWRHVVLRRIDIMIITLNPGIINKSTEVHEEA